MINLREYIIQRVLYYYRIWFSIIKWIVVLVTSWVITTAQSAPGWILTLPRRAFLKKVPCGRLRGCTFWWFFFTNLDFPEIFGYFPFLSYLFWGPKGRVRFPGSPQPNAIDPRWQHHEAGGTQGALSGETGGKVLIGPLRRFIVSSWWLNQPIWKIWSSNLIIFAR